VPSTIASSPRKIADEPVATRRISASAPRRRRMRSAGQHSGMHEQAHRRDGVGTTGDRDNRRRGRSRARDARQPTAEPSCHARRINSHGHTPRRGMARFRARRDSGDRRSGASSARTRGLERTSAGTRCDSSRRARAPQWCGRPHRRRSGTKGVAKRLAARRVAMPFARALGGEARPVAVDEDERATKARTAPRVPRRRRARRAAAIVAASPPCDQAKRAERHAGRAVERHDLRAVSSRATSAPRPRNAARAFFRRGRRTSARPSRR